MRHVFDMNHTLQGVYLRPVDKPDQRTLENISSLEHYNSILADCRQLFVRKTEDYGTSWRILRLPSLTDQIFIKAGRIRSIQEKGKQKIDEPVDGEFKAIVNYGIMANIQDSLGDTAPLELSSEQAAQYYDTAAEEIRQLFIAKNHDYGEAWRDMRISSITDLILVKLLRIKQIEDNDGVTTVSEGVVSNYQDIVNYAIFALILLEENAQS